MKRKRKNKNTEWIANLLILSVIGLLAWLAVNAAFSQMETRVCNNSSASAYDSLHCDEVK